MDPSRIDHPQTINEFKCQLERLFPQAKIEDVAEKITEKHVELEENNTCIFVSIGEKDEGPHIECELAFERKLDNHEVRFIRFFERVFNNDIKSAPRLGKDKELWLSLQQTRLARVIARFSQFHTSIFLKWLRAFENAISLRYEGQPFATQIVLTKQIDWIRKNPNVDYVRFSQRMDINRALFEEKWIRSLAADGNLSLVGLGHDRGIVGVVYPHPVDNAQGLIIPPHSSLEDFCSMLVPGTLGLLASRQGDLRVLLPTGVTFMKSQGHWAMTNLNLLDKILSEMLNRSVAVGLMRLAADLSYEGQGALLCCVKNIKFITELVPDHSDSNRVSQNLRLMGRRLNIKHSGHQRILKRVAAIDGAIILAPDGSILDAACMISDPSTSTLEEAGINNRVRFSGARSTAAWNASVFGIAVKISEDGPITVFKNGKLVLQL